MRLQLDGGPTGRLRISVALLGLGLKLLGGSWVVISGVISRVTIVITHIRGLITLTYNYPWTSKYYSSNPRTQVSLFQT